MIFEPITMGHMEGVVEGYPIKIIQIRKGCDAHPRFMVRQS